ncbi:YoaK family protein [Neisseria shayeganii]|uniref:Protein of hypothetical function DUF1275 n=1 Tax=Neisseria shayeganii 871 TaxID=1032488 RepID=G4CLF3_9NEIS|nr:YoaK family protein [Neisseria shayeganii]EGY51323.1 protein of hypothetical function DUF1275 [Neisseria shayeganii 871]
MTRPAHRYRLSFWQTDKPYIHESPVSDIRFRLLGAVMAFLAGAINAGGFFAVGSYTSHVSGELSRAADMLYLGEWQLALTAALVVAGFIVGATHGSWMILWAKRQRFRSSYGLTMWLEALYLLLFGLMGSTLSEFTVFVPATLFLLCAIMGMHNTVISVLSNGQIRATHMTGHVTDMGIELSKMLYYRHDRNPRLPDVRVDRTKFRLLAGMLLAFVLGGVAGAWGIHHMGYHFTWPVAAVLFLLGFGSVGHDVRLRLAVWLRRHKRY